MDFNIDSFMFIILNFPKLRLRVRQVTINCLVIALTSCTLAWTFWSHLSQKKKQGGGAVPKQGRSREPWDRGRGCEVANGPRQTCSTVSLGARRGVQGVFVH